MPASPVTIFTPPGAGATPTTPGAIYEPAPAGKAVLAITGVATAGVNGSLIYAGLNDAKPAWSSDGTLTAGASNTICKSDAGVWSLSRGSAYAATKTSGAATPDGLTAWTVGTGSSSPILAAATVAAAAVVFTPPSAGAAPAAPGVVFTPPSAGGAPAIAATGLVTFTGLPTNAETITVNGRVYSFSATAPLATSEILIGANAEAMATNMTFAINSPFVGSANAVVTASVSFSGYEVRLTAKVSGTGGNALTLAKTASNTAISGATLTGGAPGSLAPPVAVFGT